MGKVEQFLKKLHKTLHPKATIVNIFEYFISVLFHGFDILNILAYRLVYVGFILPNTIM